MLGSRADRVRYRPAIKAGRATLVPSLLGMRPGAVRKPAREPMQAQLRCQEPRTHGEWAWHMVRHAIRAARSTIASLSCVKEPALRAARSRAQPKPAQGPPSSRPQLPNPGRRRATSLRAAATWRARSAACRCSPRTRTRTGACPALRAAQPAPATRGAAAARARRRRTRARPRSRPGALLRGGGCAASRQPARQRAHAARTEPDRRGPEGRVRLASQARRTARAGSTSGRPGRGLLKCARARWRASAACRARAGVAPARTCAARAGTPRTRSWPDPRAGRLPAAPARVGSGLTAMRALWRAGGPAGAPQLVASRRTSSADWLGKLLAGALRRGASPQGRRSTEEA